MRIAVLLLCMISPIVFSGCVSDNASMPPSPVQPPPELPLSEIPAYPDLQKSYDMSAKVCVYSTLWISKPIADGLINAGYTVLPQCPDSSEKIVVSPDLIVEPLSFRHTTELRQGNLWLFTRVVVQVRRPLRVVSDETQTGSQIPPRIFQVYARENLGVVSSPTEENYRANVDVAVGNLLRVDAFRESLVR